ncbi:uncharacterized protein At3g28850 [Amborella trichopoda]|uniref:Glutaredoxin domain-containing protein n=1 Tax=Amborella trichopoda TaxID=13333 RepID=W1NXI7_AMBTC|nr:uncharacterized protein At3g28850 [Amborella trichopoda]ERN02322.1 hypothetical protein AMTR_s00084p00178510 [Amborella trichopoda]|eukprot:XP_006840647.1 uncharacterized protein At3g28850 [Amborella trichopoda]
MGCVSSRLTGPELGGDDLKGHIVSLTSTTYGLVTLDYPSPKPSSPFTLTFAPSLPLMSSSPILNNPESEVINTWEFMDGLSDTDSFRFSPLPALSPSPFKTPKSGGSLGKENACNPFLANSRYPPFQPTEILKDSNSGPLFDPELLASLEREMIKENRENEGSKTKREKGGKNKGFPENAVVLYTTTLRGIRKTFEECNRVRTVLEGLGVQLVERDISMDSGFRDELATLMGGKPMVPRVFVKGVDIGGSEDVLRIHEEGQLVKLVEGVPKARATRTCDGCGGVRFVPCFDCCGSRKIVEERGKVLRCSECNENGLIQCPICC